MVRAYSTNAGAQRAIRELQERQAACGMGPIAPPATPGSVMFRRSID